MISKKQTYVIAFLLNIFFVLVSTPWEFGNTFFGDSKESWVLYYVLGFILSFYVTYIFIWTLKMLLNHTCEYFKEINHDDRK